MRKIKLIFYILCILIVTGCSNQTQLNVFDYTHKSAVIFKNLTDVDSQFEDALSGLLGGNNE